MKIVAIRGKNLASLEGGFAVEFEQAPLARAGLFAITGPTGAGKSTILDALCLALFDEMPRLPAGQGVPVGRADEDDALRTRSNDVRSILRRGAAEGFAEVEFIGSDHQRYLARWEVRRARNAASGRLQAQTMSLTSLANNQQIGRTKSEVQEAIRDRLGLSFEQFRRSVLLAQGDFASFLKADAKQRSELLERMTGTEIYGALSKAAHSRAVLEEIEMKRIEQRLGDLLPMPPEERIALEVQHKAMLEAQLQLDQSRQDIKRVIDWHERLSQLKAAEGEAIAKVAAAEQVSINASERRKELEVIQAVQPLRALVDRMDHSAQELIETEKMLATAQAEEQQTAKQVSELQQTVATDKAYLVKHESELALSEPALRQARVLDTQLTGVLAEQAHCQQAVLAAEEKANEAAKKQTEIAEQCQKTENALAESEQWLQANTRYAELASQWQRWDQELTSLVEADQSKQAATIALASLEASLPLVQQQLNAETDQQTELNASVSDAEKEIEIWEAQASALPLEQLRQDRERFQNRQNGLRTLMELQKKALDSNKQLDLIMGDLVRNQAESERLQLAMQKANEQLIASRAALTEAERSQHLALTARKADVASLRNELIEGESCPVCGSNDHPWVSGQPGLEQLLDQMVSRVHALREEVNNLTGAYSQLEAEHATVSKLIRELEIRKPALSAELAHLGAQWKESCSMENLSNDVLAAEINAQLAERTREIDAALKSIAESESQAHQLQAMLQEKRNELQQSRLALNAASENIANLTLRLQKLNNDHAQQARELVKAEAVRKQIIERLAPVLAGVDNWQRRLEEDVPSLRQTCEQIITQWQVQTRQRDEATNGLATRKETLAAALTEATHTAENSNKAQAAFTGIQAKLADLQAQRKILLEGRPADQVESELKTAITSASNALQVAQNHLSNANEQLAVSRKTIQHWQADMVKRLEAKTHAENRVNEALAKHEMSLDLLRQKLVHSEEWLRAEQAELNEIHTLLLEAKTRQATLQEQRVAHEAANPPTVSSEDASAQLVELENLHQSSQDKTAEIRASLKQDDEKQNQGIALRSELEKQQEKWHLWGGLKELIGSQDGSKFRSFAQSLTLDALLGYANRHLEELARRYLLQRVPGSDLELQVIDREMGDEVRSVHSLSGGESFLISLALALGLASLSSNRTQVESLFIDEGFGSLDPATLDIAIASLDALQSLGRKVGVISHVPAMVERIGVQVRVGVHGGGKSSVKTFGAFMD